VYIWEYIKFIDQAFVLIKRYITSHAVKIHYLLNDIIFYYNFCLIESLLLNAITFMFPNCVSDL
jgi:hypothetical protein